MPQGGVLSGLLFSIFINDLPLHIEYCDNSLYADDAKIYLEIRNAEDINHMQRDINNMVNWCNKWRLVINPSIAFIYKITHVQFSGSIFPIIS